MIESRIRSGCLLVVVTAMAVATAGAARPEPSAVCGGCHRDIYLMWKESTHASAMDNLPFFDAYRDAASRKGASLGRVCLSCHAPMAAQIGDTELDRKVSWEGVTCDYCHGIVSVDMSGRGPDVKLDIEAIINPRFRKIL